MAQQPLPHHAAPPDHGAHTNRSLRGRLTANAIQGLKPRANLYELTDPACAGLKIRVMPSGVKSWAYRFYWYKKRQLMSLGFWPDLGLSAARELAGQARTMMEKGIDPRKAGIGRRTSGSAVDATKSAGVFASESAAVAPVPNDSTALGDASGERARRGTDLSLSAEDLPADPHSIKFLAHEFYHRHIIKERGRLRPEYAKGILNRDVLPFWSDRDARTISSREIIERLDAIVDRGSPVMANRAANVLSQMFMYGIHRAIVVDSPVKLLYRPGGTEIPAERALSEGELKSFLLNCKTVCLTSRGGHILMVLLLTMQRRQEIALAKKNEFDLVARTWSIPDERAKGKRGKRRGHVLPLTDWAAEELEALMRLSGDSPYLLPRRNGRLPINPMLITRSVERLQHRFTAVGIEPFTPHDLRRTGRTGLAALGVDDEIGERVLNHQKKGMKRVCDRYAYFDEKRTALEKWTTYLTGLRDQALREKALAASTGRSETTS